MIYESTGEIRTPREGEYYIIWNPNYREISRSVAQYEGSPEVEGFKRIIMRPIQPTLVCENCLGINCEHGNAVKVYL